MGTTPARVAIACLPLGWLVRLLDGRAACWRYFVPSPNSLLSIGGGDELTILLETISVHKSAAVLIETQVSADSLQNGSFAEQGRRLSAISTSSSQAAETQAMRKSDSGPLTSRSRQTHGCLADLGDGRSTASMPRDPSSSRTNQPSGKPRDRDPRWRRTHVPSAVDVVYYNDSKHYCGCAFLVPP